jgi:hypothetical protein
MKPMKWVLLALIVLVAFGMSQADNTYIGAKKCKMCHKVQFTSWEGMSHATTFDRLKGDEQSKAECLACHATNNNAEMPGVQCESCHGAGSGYKKMSVMKDHDASIAAGLVLPTEETCLGCHTGAPHDQKEFVFADRVKEGVHEHKAEK